MATISVVIPALNDAVLLRGCLGALATQTRAPDEIIVVDNGSTDDTAAVAIAGGARVVSEPIRGIFPATAAGFDAASGDILARLDADSRPMPGWIERVERTLADQHGLVAVTGPGTFYGAGPVKRVLGRVIWIGGMFWFTRLVLGHPMVFGSNYAMPAEIWRRVRGTVHRDLRDVHDDLDLSYHFEPDMTVLYDRELVVQVSARPFDSFGSLWRRLSLVWSTLSLDFAEQSPAIRRRLRTEWATAQVAENGAPQEENPGLAG
ncbi:glycosyltransferase family A protein [soil metagenome]